MYMSSKLSQSYFSSPLIFRRDDMSDIQKIAVGLGYTQYDEGLINFKYYYNRSHLTFPGDSLPQGVFMYGRLRSVNNGKLPRSFRLV